MTAPGQEHDPGGVWLRLADASIYTPFTLDLDLPADGADGAFEALSL